MFKTKEKLKTKEFTDLSEVKLSDHNFEKKEGGVLPNYPKKAFIDSSHHNRFFPKVLLFIAFLFIFGGIGASICFGLWETGEIDIAELTSKQVVVNINSQPRMVSTNSETVGQLLKELEIHLSVNDYLDKKKDQPVVDGMEIWMRLSIPIQIMADDKIYELKSQPVTVKTALAKAGIQINDKDKVSLPLLSYIYDETRIEICRVSVKTEMVDEYIEQAETIVEHTYLAPGARIVISEGSSGINRTTYEVTTENGKETARVLISTERLRDPKERVIGIGSANSTGTATKAMTTISDGISFYYNKSFSVEATAYSWTGNTTATGTWPKKGTIAVDPKIIPLGSKVYVPGYGFAVAEDTGGVVKNYIIDLYMDSKDACINWGRRQVTIYILE